MVSYRVLEVANHEELNDIADDWFSLQTGVEKRNEIIDLLYQNVEEED